jgi:hypothetical protein
VIDARKRTPIAYRGSKIILAATNESSESLVRDSSGNRVLASADETSTL